MEIEPGQLSSAGFTLNWPERRVYCKYCDWTKEYSPDDRGEIYNHIFECKGETK